MRTAKNILRHEIIGLNCAITESKNRHYAGIKGKIVDETMKTIKIETESGIKTVLKKGTVFRLDVNAQKVDVQGDAIIARPEDRIKKKIRKW